MRHSSPPLPVRVSSESGSKAALSGETGEGLEVGNSHGNFNHQHPG